MPSSPRFILLVTGSRDAVSQEHCEQMHAMLKGVLRKYPPGEWDVTVVHGAARGADVYLGELAKIYGCKVVAMPADWDTHKKEARPIRNQQMVDRCARARTNGAKIGCLAFPATDDYARFCEAGRSGRGFGGTCDCIERAEFAEIKVHAVPLDVTAERMARKAREVFR